MNIAEFVKNLTPNELRELGKTLGRASLVRLSCVITGINDAQDSTEPGELVTDQLGAWHLSHCAESLATVVFRSAKLKQMQMGD